MTYTIKLRRGLASDWSTVNPILAEGELGYELDTRYFKVGDGLTNWNGLEYTVDSDQYLPDATELEDGQILITFGGNWLIADPPSGLPDPTGLPDGKMLVTVSEEWVVTDAPSSGDPNAMLSAPAHLRYTYNATEPTSPQDGDLWLNPDDDPPPGGVDEADVRAITAAQLVQGNRMLITPVGDTLKLDYVEPDGIILNGPEDYGFGATAALDVLPSGWSFMRAAAGGNQLTYQEGNGGGVLSAGGSYTYDQGIQRSLPSGFVSALFKFSAMAGIGNEGPGVYLREASTGRHYHFTLRASGAMNLTNVSAGGGTVGTDTAGAGWVAGPINDMYMKVVRNSATSWDWYWGPSPTNLIKIYAATNPTALTYSFTPDQIGFGFLCLGGGYKSAVLKKLKFT